MPRRPSTLISRPDKPKGGLPVSNLSTRILDSKYENMRGKPLKDATSADMHAYKNSTEHLLGVIQGPRNDRSPFGGSNSSSKCLALATAVAIVAYPPHAMPRVELAAAAAAKGHGLRVVSASEFPHHVWLAATGNQVLDDG